MTNEEYDKLLEQTLGAKKPKYDRRDFRIAGIVSAPVERPPVYFIFGDIDGDPFPVKNQFSRGSCTSQGYTHHKERDEGVQLSAPFAMAKTKELEGNTDYGAYTVNQFKVGKDTGTCIFPMYPEPDPTISWLDLIDITRITPEMINNAKEHRLESYWFIDNSVIQDTLLQFKKSVVISMAWYSSFNRPTNGILTTKYSNYVGGHAVEIVGYSDYIVCDDGSIGAYRVKNSWGEGWGDNGYFWLPYSILNKISWGGNCSLDIPKDLRVDIRYGKPRTWNSFLYEQYTAFKNTWLRGKIGRLPSNREISGIVYGAWDYESVFKGRCGDIWLNYTKPEARAKKLINY